MGQGTGNIRNAYGRDKNPSPGNGNGKGNRNAGSTQSAHSTSSSTLQSEYTGEYTGDALAEYYMGANDQVVSRKMFGFHNRKDQGYLGNLRDRGHQLFYHYDAMGNVNDLTDHLGSEVFKYATTPLAASSPNCGTRTTKSA